MRAACFQFDVRAGDVDHNLSEVESALRAAHSQNCELVVLPEMWPTSFPATDDIEPLLSATERALHHVMALTRELPLAVCGSAFGRTSGLPTNRWHLIEGGRLLTSYDKVHLFTPTAEDASFSAGEGPPTWADTRAGRVGGIVCYDLRFPEVARVLFRGGVEVITVSAQWPVERIAHWEALLAGRAVESQAFVVACNRTGKALVGRRKMELTFPGRSQVLTPDGAVIAKGDATQGLIVTELDPGMAAKMRSRIPVQKDERRGTYYRWRGAIE
jgi:omega-amidase